MIRWMLIRWRMGWMTGRAAAACAGSVRPDMGPGGRRAYIMLSTLTFFLYVDFYACFYIWDGVSSCELFETLICATLQGISRCDLAEPGQVRGYSKIGNNLYHQRCIFRLTCSHHELTKDHVLTSAYVKIFRTLTRNAVNKSVWRKKYCSWLPLDKHAMNVFI